MLYLIISLLVLTHQVEDPKTSYQKCLEQIAIEFYIDKIKNDRDYVSIKKEVFPPNSLAMIYCYNYGKIDPKSNQGENWEELLKIQCKEIKNSLGKKKRVYWENSNYPLVYFFKKKKIKTVVVFNSFNINNDFSIVILAEISNRLDDVYYSIKIKKDNLKVVDHCKSEFSS